MNLCKLLKRKAELEARLRNSQIDICALVPRRRYGSIAVVRAKLADIDFVEHIAGAERMWCVLKTNLKSLLISNWYRPPDEDGSSVVMLQT